MSRGISILFVIFCFLVISLGRGYSFSIIRHACVSLSWDFLLLSLPLVKPALKDDTREKFPFLKLVTPWVGTASRHAHRYKLTKWPVSFYQTFSQPWVFGASSAPDTYSRKLRGSSWGDGKLGREEKRRRADREGKQPFPSLPFLCPPLPLRRPLSSRPSFPSAPRSAPGSPRIQKRFRVLDGCVLFTPSLVLLLRGARNPSK